MGATSWQFSIPVWLRGLAPVVAVVFLGSIGAHAVAEQPIIAYDAAFYQYVGWLITRGGTPYVDIWDVNPPLTFVLTAGLAFLAGGNMLLLHILSATTTLLSVLASVLVVGWLAAFVTGEDVAGIVAGIVLCSVPEVYGLPPYGVRSQYFSLAFVVVALALVHRDRPGLAGASVAAAAGFWQGGIVAVPLVLGMIWSRRGRHGVRRAVSGGIGVTALTVFPFVAAGAAGPMVVETVVAPLYGRAPNTLLGRGFAILAVLGYTAFLLPVASIGWVHALASRDRLWIPAGALLYGGFALFGNMDGALDLLLWLVFVALGVSIVVELVSDRLSYQIGLVALVLTVVLVNPVWHLSDAPIEDSVESARDDVEAERAPPTPLRHISPTEMRTIYWQKRRPETCHLRLSWTERRWIHRTDATLNDETCGEWPF